MDDIFENEVEVKADLPQNAQVRQYMSSIEIGDVATLPAGSQATVTNSGTEENVILNFGLPKGDSGSMWGELSGNITDQTDLNTILTGLRTDVNAKAPSASPTLTGTPTAPTAADNTNTTQIATTAFVKNAITLLRNELNARINNMLGRMDFSNIQDFTASWGRQEGQHGTVTTSSFTVPSNGYIWISSINNSSSAGSSIHIDVDYKINNSVLLNITGTAGNITNYDKDEIFRIGRFLPVTANDVISVDGKTSYSIVSDVTFSISGRFIAQAS